MGNTRAFVGLEQDARPIDDPSGTLAATDQPLQLVPIIRRQPYRIFLRNRGAAPPAPLFDRLRGNHYPPRAASANTTWTEYWD